jgi:hypothetical protein
MTSQRDMVAYQLAMIKKAEDDRIAATKGKSDARAMNAQLAYSALVAYLYGTSREGTQKNDERKEEKIIT